ncbi:discoidin domain-containing protein [Hyunsoonleella sp. SJ7]|uniref:Discoidin domain-containing protein n=1 Tax=Hyunsoonleella aquatilis TaxID=2762758 RepID=A0A923H843_9FLAO|nr:glycosyl hydrolase [Hyunsoonleella aquatilis]MBC3758716.1 discoidin domain-containing protein [Hyunsoonleella aquatilis]
MNVDFSFSIKQMVLLFCLISILTSCQNQNVNSNSENKVSLEKGFKNPPQNTKPRTWYHINSGNASKEGFTKDLKAIKEAGIGGVLVFNVSMGLPEGDVKYNSQEHRDILTHAAKECEKLGLSFGVHNCDGWTSSGGPWVTPENAMKVVVNSQVIAEGGKQVNLKLPQPPARHNFYKDIAVVAYPTLETELIDDSVNPIITSSDEAFNADLATDHQTNTHADLKADQWVQYDYGKPRTLRSINVFINKRKGRFTLLKSNDGINFTVVHKPKEARIGKDECYFYESFKPITARYFRIKTEMDAGIYEMQLSANPVLGNVMEYTSYRKNRRPITEADANAYIKKEDIIVLSDQMDANGVLKATLPKGNWTIMRFGFTASGSTNEPASDEGTGLEVDKFSKKALKIHYDAFVGKLVKQAKIDAPNALQYVEIDSYEVGPQNWTGDMEQLFEERFNYDFVPFLPLFAGKHIENEATIESVFWDMKQLVSDLMVTNYFDYFTELCHQDGLISYVEPYGFVGPFNSLDAGRRADIPMGEFWLGKPNNHKRAPVSSAHIYGKNVISAEAFTSTKLNWSFHPALAKQKGDYEWTNGINEYMFHRFAHQSNTHVKPGMSMSFVGSHIDRTQTWWDNAGPEWFNYLARGSYMLRQGNPVLDVLVFVGDRAPSHVIHAKQMRPKLPASYKYDCVNSDVIINRLSVEDGKLKLPNGITYNALSLQRNDIINLETLKGIHKLSQQGALVVGKKPQKLGGYVVTEAMQKEFDTLVNEIWSSKRTYSTGEWEEIFKENNIQKDLIVEGQPDFNFYHRRTEKEDIYFVYNHNLTESETLNCSFLIEGKVPELWNAETGEITKLVEYTTKNGRTNISIEMHLQESVFVVFKEAETVQPRVTYNQSEDASKPAFSLDGDNNLQAEVFENGNYSASVNDSENWNIEVNDIPNPLEITGNWDINFREQDFYKATIQTDKLFDWSTHDTEQIKHYSGTAIYKTTFNIEKGMLQSDRQFQLNLGEVNVIAKVLVNGQDIGVSWIAPHTLNVTDVLKEGENALEIQVTNQWTNRLIGDEKLPNQTGYDVRRGSPGFGDSEFRGKFKKMPEWYRNNKPLPEGPRKTFSVYGFQKATDKLLPSGLLGPVTITTSKIIKRK